MMFIHELFILKCSQDPFDYETVIFSYETTQISR